MTEVSQYFKVNSEMKGTEKSTMLKENITRDTLKEKLSEWKCC